MKRFSTLILGFFLVAAITTQSQGKYYLSIKKLTRCFITKKLPLARNCENKKLFNFFCAAKYVAKRWKFLSCFEDNIAAIMCLLFCTSALKPVKKVKN